MPGHNSSNIFSFFKQVLSKWLIILAYSLGLVLLKKYETQLFYDFKLLWLIFPAFQTASHFQAWKNFSSTFLSTQWQCCHCLPKEAAESQLPGKQDLWPHICQKIKQTRAHSHVLGLEPANMLQLVAGQLKSYSSIQPGQIQTAFWKQSIVSPNPRTMLGHYLGEC